MSGLSFLDKLFNRKPTASEASKKPIDPIPESSSKKPLNSIMAQEKVVIAINEFKHEYPAHSRQRKNVYRYLNKKLDLNLAVYDYDDTGENTILSLDPNGTKQAEYRFIIDKFANALLEKHSNS